jgi:hypothetical protein
LASPANGRTRIVRRSDKARGGIGQSALDGKADADLIARDSKARRETRDANAERSVKIYRAHSRWMIPRILSSGAKK